MKKIAYISLTIFILLLAACGAKSDPTTTKAPETEKPAPSEDVANSQGNASDEKVEDEGNEQPTEPVESTEPVVEKMYTISPANWTVKPIGSAPDKVVLLTIDDAPDKYALEMAHTLKELNVPAIFFVNGHFLASDEEKQTLKSIYDLGFVIGNHTKTHASLPDLTEAEQKEEIVSVNQVIEEVTGEKPIFFRAPFGQNTDFSTSLIESEGMAKMNWTFGYDWEKQYMNADALADILVNTPLLARGSIILMHDREWTKDALRQIVDGYRANGYGFVDPKTIDIGK